jgi:hypothetical protein
MLCQNDNFPLSVLTFPQKSQLLTKEKEAKRKLQQQ